MIKRLRLCLFIVLSLTACRVMPQEGDGFRPPPEAETERLRIDSERLGAGILRAFQQADFAALRRNTPGELSERITESDFLTSCRNFGAKFGKLTEFRFLTALDTPAFCNLIWVATFVRKGKNGGDIRRQLLFRVVTMTVDDKIRVVSYGFL